MTAASQAVDAIAALDAAQTAMNATATQAVAMPLSQAWSPDLVRFLAIAVLLFTFGALLLGTLLLWRSRSTASQVLRIFGVISIIGVSALLLVVGYSNDQLTPIVGLFGAIAGYLLGKDSPSVGSHEERPSRPRPT
jgi:CHASE2 domain-containing sensor protein